MPAIHETAYPRIKPNLSPKELKELKELFTPTEEELFLLDSKTKKTLTVTRLGFMLMLKCYQYLGRPVTLPTLDVTIKNYLAEQMGIDPLIDLTDYSKNTRHRHIQSIREYLQINSDKLERRKAMKKTALDAATKKENLADIINCIIDELVKSKFQLPAFQKLVRLARAARTVVNNSNYQRIFSSLSDKQKKSLDIITGITTSDEPGDNPITWSMLKLEPKKPTPNNVKTFVKHVNNMRALRQEININLDFITPSRIEQLRDEALTADLADMKEIRPIKRHALATILIYMQTSFAIDDLIKICIGWIKSIEAQAKNKLEQYRLEQADKTDEYILILYKTLLALKNNHSAQAKIQEIEQQLGGKTDELIEECRADLHKRGKCDLAT